MPADTTEDGGGSWRTPVAAAPLFAATLALLVARALPVTFEYHPNTVGIISTATLQKYPSQQEIFWLVFATSLGGVAAMAIAIALSARPWRRRDLLGVEIGSAVTLVAALCLPAAAAWGILGLCAAAAIALGRRGAAPGEAASGRAPGAATEPAPRGQSPGTTRGAPPSDQAPRSHPGELQSAPSTGPPAGEPRSEQSPGPAPAELPRAQSSGSAARRSLFAGPIVASLAIALALLVNPLGTRPLHYCAARTPDEALVSNTWNFQAELGQHLAWADAYREGRLQGRDFFCLYGPYLELGLVGLWGLIGRSIATGYLYVASLYVLGMLCAVFLASLLVRRRGLVLLIPLMATPTALRHGLGLLGLACLVLWMRGEKRMWAVAAGLVAGVALMFSQEYGLALILSAAVLLSLRRDARAAGGFILASLATAAPAVLWYAAHGALVPFARDLLQYPAWVAAGFGKLPFPSLFSRLPLAPADWVSLSAQALRAGYLGPAVCVAAAVLSIPVAGLRLRAPLASTKQALEKLQRDPGALAILATSLYGLLSFRTSLGRSDLVHIMSVMSVPATLLLVALDRSLGVLRRGGVFSALALWRALGVLLLCGLAALFQIWIPLSTVQSNLEDIVSLWREPGPPPGNAVVNQVAGWIESHTSPADRVTFLPNDAAYYYLTRRRDPTRFVLFHQLITDAHRAEALSDIRTRPPRYLVIDEGAWRVDGIRDPQILGAALFDYLRSHYESETQFGDVFILRPVGGRPPAAPAG